MKKSNRRKTSVTNQSSIMKKKSSNCYYYSSYYVVIAIFLVGSMIGDYFNNNILGGSNGNTNIFVNAKNAKNQAPTQLPTSELKSEPTTFASTVSATFLKYSVIAPGLTDLQIIADQFTKTAYEVLFGTEDNAISRNANNGEDNEDGINVRHLSHHHRFIRRNLQGDDGTIDDGTTDDTTAPFVPGTSEYDENVVKIKSVAFPEFCTDEYGVIIESGIACIQVFMEVDSVPAVLSKADLDQIGSDITSTVESGLFQDILVTGGLAVAVFVPPPPTTRAPTPAPTKAPTLEPTREPTQRPTRAPTKVGTPAPTPTPKPTPTEDELLLDIPGTAASAGVFYTLVAALGAANLVEALSEPNGPYTVFAPTDDAFNALPDGLVECLLEDENHDVLSSILQYHVVSGEVLLNDLEDGAAETLQGEDVTVDVTEGIFCFPFNCVKINESTVIAADIVTSNGVIHVLDAVLVPPSIVDLEILESCCGGGFPTAPSPPTRDPTRAPTREPTQRPTQAPTRAPTPAPTNGFPTAPSPPTQRPTQAPTRAPTRRPTPAPTNGFPTAPSPPTQRPTTEPIWGGATPAPTQAPTPAPATPEPTKDPARERISRFVEEGQMFFVRENQIALGRNSSSPIFPSMTNQFNNIEWFCKPAFSPANNNDGNYNNVISSFITFKLDINKFGDTGGFTAAWSVGTTNFGGSYEEYGTDYTIRTNRYNDVGDSSRSSTIQWTLDGLGSTTGLVTSGEGRWTFDTTESIFNVFKEALNGRDLTGETCKAIYDEIYVEETTRNPTQAPKEKKSRKNKKTNKNRKSERKLQTTLLEDNYDVKENKEYVSLKAQVDKLEKTVAVLLLRLDETITRAS